MNPWFKVLKYKFTNMSKNSFLKRLILLKFVLNIFIIIKIYNIFLKIETWKYFSTKNNLKRQLHSKFKIKRKLIILKNNLKIIKNSTSLY